jgi:Mor family transcriptional regulator
MNITPHTQTTPRNPKNRGVRIPRPNWTKEEEDEIVRQYTVDGIYSLEIAKSLGQPLHHIRNLLKERGVLKARVGTITIGEAKEEQIVEGYKNGKSVADLEKEFECGYRSIRRIFKMRGIIMRGAKKLFDTQQELEIVTQYMAGATIKTIAKSFKCSFVPINRVLRKHNVTTRYGKDHSTAWLKKNDHKVLPPYVFLGRKQGAIQKGYTWEITEEDVEAQFKAQGGLCYYTGLPMQTACRKQEYIAKMKPNPLALSIDRRDSDKEYTKDNIVLCCRFVNLAKSAYPEDVFKRVLMQAAESLMSMKEKG